MNLKTKRKLQNETHEENDLKKIVTVHELHKQLQVA